MNNKYKIGNWIVYIDKEWSNFWKKMYGISLYGKIGKIIDINKNYESYLIEFKEFINSYTSNRRGKEGYGLWGTKQEITLYKDYFKLKKLLNS